MQDLGQVKGEVWHLGHSLLIMVGGFDEMGEYCFLQARVVGVLGTSPIFLYLGHREG